MAPLVFLGIRGDVPFGPLTQRNDGFNAAIGQTFAQPMGIECLVADQGQAAMPSMRTSKLVMS